MAVRIDKLKPNRKLDVMSGDIPVFSLIVLSMSLNFLLATLNARGIAMDSTKVTAIQAALLLPCAVIIWKRKAWPTARFLIPLALLIVLALVASLVRGFNPKAIYDILIIPIFMLIGMRAAYITAGMLNMLLAYVCAVATFEVARPELYTAIVNPLLYYMQTRDWGQNDDASDALDSGLYMGANRSGGLVLSALTDHRVGSIFLEPLSLGYFSVIMALCYVVLYKHSIVKQGVAFFLCLMLSLVSDSRLASATIVAIFLLGRLPKAVPAIVTWYVPPLVLASAGSIYAFAGTALGSGDTMYRLSITFDAFARSTISGMLFGDVDISRVGDSGYVYLVYCVGLVGLFPAIYVCSGLFLSDWKRWGLVPLMASVYLSSSLLFGEAVFSIKTAALLGVVLGAVANGRFATRADPRPTPRRRTAPGRVAAPGHAILRTVQPPRPSPPTAGTPAHGNQGIHPTQV